MVESYADNKPLVAKVVVSVSVNQRQDFADSRGQKWLRNHQGLLDEAFRTQLFVNKSAVAAKEVDTWAEGRFNCRNLIRSVTDDEQRIAN